MQKREQLYGGKAKKVFKTDDERLLTVSGKDDATAFNGLKKGTIAGNGFVNNRISNLLMRLLEKCEAPTHFVKELSAFRAEAGGTPVGFKFEFKRLSDGTVALADEISPDTRGFRRDPGGIGKAYGEITDRLTKHITEAE